MVPGHVHMQWEAVVEVGEGNAVLGADWLADNDLVYIIELIPILLTATGQEKLLTAMKLIHTQIAKLRAKDRLRERSHPMRA